MKMNRDAHYTGDGINKTVRFPKWLSELTDKLAEDEGMHFSAFLRQLIDNALAKEYPREYKKISA